MPGDPMLFWYHLKEFHEKRHNMYLTYEEKNIANHHFSVFKYCKPSFSVFKYCKNIISSQILVKMMNTSTNCHNFVNNILELVYFKNL